MTLPRTIWPLATGLAVALTGCQSINPAFDPDGGDGGTEGDGDTSTTMTTTTQSTTQSSAGDGDPGDGDPGDGDPGDGDPGDGDGDTADGPDSGMESPIEDLPEELCEVETHPGLWPRFGAPEQFLNQVCPPGFSGTVRAIANAENDWLVGFCPLGCSAPCDLQTQWRVGADHLGFGPGTLWPAAGFNPNTPWIGCYYVEVAEYLKQHDDACYYASLSIHTHEGPSSPLLFNANRQGYGLTQGAVMKFGEWTPEITDQQVPSCACDELEGVECCPGSTVVAKQFELNGPVLPPDGTGYIMLGQSPFEFLGAQAQSGTSCENDPEISWALWASP